MKDNSRIRDAQMMNAVAGMGGRNALSSEVDLRLGLTPNVGTAPSWFGAFVRRMMWSGTVQSAAGSDPSAPEPLISSNSRALETAPVDMQHMDKWEVTSGKLAAFLPATGAPTSGAH